MKKFFLMRVERAEAYKEIRLIALGTVALMALTLYNGYPVLNSDSNTYIQSAFTLSPPTDRPLFYGVFIRLTSLCTTLWTVSLVQCAILAWLMTDYIRGEAGGVRRGTVLMVVFLTSVCTICGWYSGQMMPDIFSAAMILATHNLIRYRYAGWKTAIYVGILVLCLTTHNSNLMTMGLTVGVLAASAWRYKKMKTYGRKIGMMAGAIGLAYLLLCTVNTLKYGKWTVNRSANMFLMGKMCENGTLRQYLNNTCATRPTSLCPYKDSLPSVAWEFVWDGNGPLAKTGGWEKNEHEHGRIIRAILTSPKYWGRLVWTSAIGTLRQLTLINIDEWYDHPRNKFDRESTLYHTVQHYLPLEAGEMEMSRTNNGAMDVLFQDHVYYIFFLLTALGYGACVLYYKMPFLNKGMVLVLGMIAINAFTAASMANVLTRLNSRVFWVLPFVLMVGVVRMVKEGKGCGRG